MQYKRVGARTVDGWRDKYIIEVAKTSISHMHTFVHYIVNHSAQGAFGDLYVDCSELGKEIPFTLSYDKDNYLFIMNPNDIPHIVTPLEEEDFGHALRAIGKLIREARHQSDMVSYYYKQLGETEDGN